MVTWKIEITQSKGSAFPWKAVVVGSNGKRQDVGEFLEEKEARSWASMELRGLMAGQQPEATAAG